MFSYRFTYKFENKIRNTFLSSFLFCLFSIFFSLFSSLCFAQNEQLAQNYFDRGDFEKALISYNELLKSQSSNIFYFQRQIECLQQLSQFDVAEKNISERLSKYKQSVLLVEMGYNYQLKKNLNKAKTYYEEAINSIKENTSNVYSIAANFEKKILLDYALKAYQKAIEMEPKYDFHFQMATLYGQLGNTDAMIENYLAEAQKNPNSTAMIQNQLTRYMNDASSDSFRQSLKKALLLKAQKNEDIFWNQYLSWFFIQQKEYSKAFIQEKAIFKREQESLGSIYNLSQLAIQENENETAIEILNYIIENTVEKEIQIQAQTDLLKLKIKNSNDAENELINKELETLITNYNNPQQTLPLQILHAHFVCFKMKNAEKAKAILMPLLDMPFNRYDTADIKMELSDILLYQEKFNQASIYYAQLEDDLKNDEKGHEASLKAAKTSYFKGDFDWALKQFKTLKSASSQLIANDALEYFLLISDSKAIDSTHTSLKKIARGDYLLYQNKNQEALLEFKALLNEKKEKEMESVALYRLGKTYEKLGDFTLALTHYLLITEKYEESIYIDEALYFAAEIYNKQLKEVEKAKSLYEKIIFKHEDSIYFIDARIKFRQLRGDKNI
jgi:tetratricopeptide (TPR) repeat protein